MNILFSKISAFFAALKKKRHDFRKRHYSGIVKRYKKLHRRKNIGIGTYWGVNCGISHKETVIGKYCSIANGVHIGTSTHPTHFLSTHPFQYIDFFGLPGGLPPEKRVQYTNVLPSKIGNDVWMGLNAIIMDGVNVGDGAVIGANAVVTKDVPPYAIVGGVPARIIRYRFSEEIINELLQLKWWDLPLEQIQELPFDDIHACLRQLRKLRGITSSEDSTIQETLTN